MCVFDDSLYFYANKYAIRTNWDLKILEMHACFIQFPDQQSYFEYQAYKEDEAKFFLTTKFLHNGRTRYLSNYFNEIVEFDRFNVRIIYTMPNYVQDRIFNKIVCVHDIIYFTDSVNLFKLTLGPNFLFDTSDIKIALIWRLFGKSSLRLYNFFNQMLVRDAQSGQLWIMGPNNVLVNQSASCKALNSNLFTNCGIFGENQDNKNAIWLSMVAGNINIEESFKFKPVDYKFTNAGIQMSDDAVKQYLLLTPELLQENFDSEIKIMQQSSQQLNNLLPNCSNNKFYVKDIKFFQWLKNKDSHSSDIIFEKEEYMVCFVQMFKNSELNEFLQDMVVTDTFLIANLIVDDIDQSIRTNLMMTQNEQQMLDVYEFALMEGKSKIIDVVLKTLKYSVTLAMLDIKYNSYHRLKDNLQSLSTSDIFKLLEAAITASNIQAIEILTPKISRTFIAQSNEQSPLITVLMQKKVDLVQPLLIYKLLPGYDLTELQVCVQNGLSDAALLFIDQIGLRNRTGDTALMMAAANGSEAMVDLCIKEKGFQNMLGQTALRAALLGRYTKIAEKLLDECGRVFLDNAGDREFHCVSQQHKLQEKQIIEQIMTREAKLLFAFGHEQDGGLQEQLKCKLRNVTLTEKQEEMESPYFAYAFNGWDRTTLLEEAHWQYESIDDDMNWQEDSNPFG